MSWTVNRKPHFKENPKDQIVVWVYALFVDLPGDYVKKSMQECTGEEITQEWLYHMGVPVEDIPELAATGARTVPVMMPYITAFFMPRQAGDRPDVVPEGAVNFAFIGQFSESKERDCIFTTWAGLTQIGQPKTGETLVVAGARGPVGATVGQIGKILGCRVVGIAGGAEKCLHVVETLGFDACIDFKADGFADALKSAVPDGIDIYFENVWVSSDIGSFMRGASPEERKLIRQPGEVFWGFPTNFPELVLGQSN